MRALLAFLMALSLSWSTTATAHVERLELHVSETLALPTRAKGYDAKESSHPSTGRFLSLDPVAGSLSEPLSTQGFTYAHANPTRFTDPDGRAVPLVCAAIGGVVGGIAGALGAWHNDTSVLKGAGLGLAGGAAVGLTCGVGLVAGGVVGVGVGATTGAIGALETAETGKDVAFAAGAGAVGGLVGGVVGAGAAAGTQVAAKHLTSTGSRLAANALADGATSALTQKVVNGKVDGTQVLIDALAGAGTRFGHAKWGRSVAPSSPEPQAKRRSYPAEEIGDGIRWDSEVTESPQWKAGQDARSASSDKTKIKALATKPSDVAVLVAPDGRASIGYNRQIGPEQHAPRTAAAIKGLPEQSPFSPWCAECAAATNFEVSHGVPAPAGHTLGRFEYQEQTVVFTRHARRAKD